MGNIYEAPVITSAAKASFRDNGTGIAYTAQANHEAGTTLVYSIGGTDAALFTVDSVTGALRFANSPSTTSAQDAGANNVYDLTVSASDGSYSSAAQEVAITVTAAPPPSVVITDNIAGTATGNVTYTFTFSEAVTGFNAADVVVVNGTKGTFTASSSSVYTLVVTPTTNGKVTVDIASAAALDGGMRAWREAGYPLEVG